MQQKRKNLKLKTPFIINQYKSKYNMETINWKQQKT